jgi:hypothetical protein
VRDNATRLVWLQESSPGVQSQAESIAYCSSLTTMGGGWRLPDIAELQTIVDETRVDPALDPAFFPAPPAEWFWSASPLVGTSGGWRLHFSVGASHSYGSATDAFRARCVR